MRRPKVSIIGAGFVGATAAHWIASKELADIVLLDVIEGVPQGKALDLLEASPIGPFDCHIKGTDDYRDTKDSEVVVVTAGLARKPGMSRDDLLLKNAEIIKEVITKVVSHSPETILLMVSNPLDAMAYLAYKLSGFPKNRVVGMAGVLDSSRLRTFVAHELKVSVEDVYALVLGGHGDSMVPLISCTTVSGIPITALLDRGRIEAIVDRTRNAGGEIVALLKTGSAYYSPGASIAQMVEAIIKDKRRLLPCSALLEGEYGERDLFIGVPIILSSRGVEKIIEVKLTQEEKKMFQASCGEVRQLLHKLNL